MGSLQCLSAPPTHPPPTFLWRRSDFPAPGEREQDGMCARLCLPRRQRRLCVCTHAHPGPGRPSPSPFCALKNEGGNLRAAVIIHPSKQTGRRQRRSREGGRDGCREEERERQTGGMKGGWGGYINSYLTVFGILHPRMRSFSLPLALLPSFLSALPSFRSCLYASLAFCAQGCVFSSQCVGWFTVHPNTFLKCILFARTSELLTYLTAGCNVPTFIFIFLPARRYLSVFLHSVCCMRVAALACLPMKVLTFI